MAKTTTKTLPLPKGILASDLKYPARGGYKLLAWLDRDGNLAKRGYGYTEAKFELWNVTNFGWVIPTLDIHGGRHGNPRRTYATVVATGATITCGNGPHVLARHTVYVKKSRFAALSPFFAKKHEGQVSANVIRDRISTRRANTIARRSMFRW